MGGQTGASCSNVCERESPNFLVDMGNQGTARLKGRLVVQLRKAAMSSLTGSPCDAMPTCCRANALTAKEHATAEKELGSGDGGLKRN